MQPSKPKPQEITYHKCTHAHTHKHIRLSVCLAVCLSVCLRLWTYVACIFRRYCVGLFCPLNNNISSLLLLMCVSVCVWPPVIVIVYVNLGIFSPILYASVAVTASNKLCTKHFRLKCKNNWKATGITFKYQQTTHTQARVRYRTIESFPCVCVCDQATKEKTTLTHLQPIVAGIQLARAAFLQFLENKQAPFIYLRFSTLLSYLSTVHTFNI